MNACMKLCHKQINAKKFAFIQNYSSSVILRELAHITVILLFITCMLGCIFHALNTACTVAIATA